MVSFSNVRCLVFFKKDGRGVVYKVKLFVYRLFCNFWENRWQCNFSTCSTSQKTHAATQLSLLTKFPLINMLHTKWMPP